MLEVSPWTVRVEGQSGRLGKSVWCLADVEVSRLRCVIVKKIDFDKSAIFTKKKKGTSDVNIAAKLQGA